MYIKNKASTQIAEIKNVRADGRELYVNGEKFETFASNAEAQLEIIRIAQAIANMDDLYDLAHQIEADDDDMDLYDEDDDFDPDEDDDFDPDEDFNFSIPEPQPVTQDDENYLAPLSNIIPLSDDEDTSPKIRYAAFILSLRQTDDQEEGDIFMDYLTDADYTRYRKQELKGTCVILKLFDVRDGKIVIPKK